LSRRRGLAIALLSLGALAGQTPAQARSPGPTPTDRWVEIDLYWFDAANPESSAKNFWDRYAPLYRGVGGYRGVTLNLGMSVEYIMTYCRPDQRIWLPDTSGQELGARVEGALPGDTAARQDAWRARFTTDRAAPSHVAYGAWTYAGLRRLAQALRRQGRMHGVADFRVGTLITAFRSSYGAVAPFPRKHPEAWTRWGAARDLLDTSSYLDLNNRLKADQGCFAGLPGGIPEGMPVHEALARQWGALARYVGLDALMMRDGMGFARAYTRYGPWGLAVPDKATAERVTGGMEALLAGIKQAAPRTVTMMYSSAATATSDWRANGLDLERIARGGNLDIFVDQSWAGAWGEVGVRRQTFWNAPILGWTYQLATFLQHQAVLSGTKVHHYFLTETFDAWESWNTIRTAPGKLAWGIWAWSHAGAKTPRGLDMPAGSYISWGNSGHDLVAARDVAFLADTLNAAARDAAITTDISGPTMVYSREVAQSQMAQLTPDLDLRDRTDEQVGTIVKWPLPVLSVTRAEWVPQVRSDLFLFGATTGMGAQTRDAIIARARAGQPMAFFGAFGTATDPAFLALGGAGVAPLSPPVQDRMLRASAGAAVPALPGLAQGFSAPPPQRANQAAPQDTVYRFATGVGLTRHHLGNLDIVLWDPPQIQDYWYRPLRDNLNGDPMPFVAAAATLNAQLALHDAPRGTGLTPDQTGTFAAWSVRGGGHRLLLGNLEDGLRDDADLSRHIHIRLPQGWRGAMWKDSTGQAVGGQAGDDLTIDLPQAGSRLLSATPER
jgi:hypothetical protein